MDVGADVEIVVAAVVAATAAVGIAAVVVATVVVATVVVVANAVAAAVVHRERGRLQRLGHSAGLLWRSRNHVDLA